MTLRAFASWRENPPTRLRALFFQAPEAVEAGVVENGKALAKIQGQLEGINGNISEIKGLLRP